MGKVGGNTGGVDDIVEGKLVNEGRELEEEGQRLPKRHLVSPCATLTCAQKAGVWRHFTCPIPPEAPATTEKAVRDDGVRAAVSGEAYQP